MVLSHRALPYRYYHATNATSACIGYVPTVPTPRYRFVGQFANTGRTHQLCLTTSCQVFTALLPCLILTSKSQSVYFWEHEWSSTMLRNDARVLWHIFCLLCVPPNTRPPQLNPESGDVENPKIHARRMFSQWLKTYAPFPVHGKPFQKMD
jgi:hypothetical protein